MYEENTGEAITGTTGSTLKLPAKHK